MRRVALLIAAVIISSILPNQAVARDLAIWDKLQGKNPKGYVLLMRHALAPGVGDPSNFRFG